MKGNFVKMKQNYVLWHLSYELLRAPFSKVPKSDNWI